MGILATSVVVGQNTEVHLGADIWPPFTDVKENKSILTVLVQEALYRRDINSDIEFDEWNEVLNRIDGGELDGSTGPVGVPGAKRKVLLFPNPTCTANWSW